MDHTFVKLLAALRVQRYHKCLLVTSFIYVFNKLFQSLKFYLVILSFSVLNYINKSIKVSSYDCICHSLIYVNTFNDKYIKFSKYLFFLATLFFFYLFSSPSSTTIEVQGEGLGRKPWSVEATTICIIHNSGLGGHSGV